MLALQTARAFFSLIVLDRSWNSSHGGVYVPVTGKTRPNPYLEDPLRDIETDKGFTLTKINPAFMTRQIAEIAKKQQGVTFSITSLKPLRPQNVPTPLEASWLKSFENGVLEQGQFFGKDETARYVYMAPLETRQACLKCHAKHGYKIGDVRGGISITLPFLTKPDYNALFFGYGIAATAGLILIFVSGFVIERKKKNLAETNSSLLQEVSQRKATEEKQQELIKRLKKSMQAVKTLEGILPLCCHCKKIRKQNGNPYRQQDWLDFDEYVDENTNAEISHSICPSCLKKHYRRD